MLTEQEEKELDHKMEILSLKADQPLIFALGLVVGFLIGLLF